MNNIMDEKLIREILEKETEMKAPKYLSARILKNWQLQESEIPSFMPIFPKWIWWLFGFFISGIFIWGFSKMSISGRSSEVAILMEQVLENIEYSIVGLEEIVLPSVVVLVMMVLINVIILRYRFPQYHNLN